MTGRDVVWLLATMLFVGGTVTIGIIWWQDRATQRQRAVRDRLVVVHPASSWRVIPRPPYDYEVEGD